MPRTCHSQNRRDWLSWIITRVTFAIPSFVWAAEPAEATQILNPTLKRGGADAPWNMQWQTIAEGKAKDATE